MRTSVDSDNKLTMLAQMSNDAKFQVLEYDRLSGGLDIKTALCLNIINDADIRLRQVRIILQDSAVKLEIGSLSYMKGDISIRTKEHGLLELGKKFLKGKATGENLIKPTYKGTGEIFLEPSFGYYALIELEDDEIIVDDGMFYACEDSVQVEVSMQRTISSIALGNKGVFQTKLKGSGIVVLELPVPESEIFRCKLNNDVLKVDGDFVVLRTGNIEFSVQKSSSVIGSMSNGEGFLNVYSGTGEVWILPTKTTYEDLEIDGLKNIIGLDENNAKE